MVVLLPKAAATTVDPLYTPISKYLVLSGAHTLLINARNLIELRPNSSRSLSVSLACPWSASSNAACTHSFVIFPITYPLLNNFSKSISNSIKGTYIVNINAPSSRLTTIDNPIINTVNSNHTLTKAVNTGFTFLLLFRVPSIPASSSLPIYILSIFNLGVQRFIKY